MFKEQLDNDLKEAIKSRNLLAADTLRMLKTRIQNESIAKQGELGEEDLLALVSSEIKRRKDSAQAYTAGNRPELAEKEQREIAVLQKYLPRQLSEEEVSKIINETIAGQNFTEKDFGKAMGMLMPKIKGKASGDIVSKLLKEKLK